MAIGLKMIEYSEVTRHPFKSQERMTWYRINSFLMDVGQIGADLKLGKSDLVHIGGTATFYHAYNAFGPKVVSHFRGTHDMDVICFNPGAMQRLLDVLKTDPDSQVSGYTVSYSHLPDKKKFNVVLKNSRVPGLANAIPIDYYETKTDRIDFNNRVISRDRIVLDPPQTLELRTLNPYKTRGLVSVASLRDSFVIKMDVMDFSRLGLRSKDKLDALTYLAICDQTGYGFCNLLEAVKQTSSRDSWLRKFNALEELFKNPQEEYALLGQDNPLLPKQETLTKATEAIQKVKRS